MTREDEYVEATPEPGRNGAWSLQILPFEQLYWSKDVFRIFGVELDKFRGTREDFLERVHPEDIDRVKSAFNRALKTEEQFNVEYRILKPDGSIRHLRDMATVMVDEKGRTTCLLGVVQDLTGRERVIKDSPDLLSSERNRKRD